MTDTHISERYEFRNIKQNEAEEAAEIERICFPPNEACSKKHMKDRVAGIADLFLVVIDKENGKMAGFLNGLATDEVVLKALENCISKEKFIEKMKQFGWNVNWTDKRKHITFQNQDGKKVRDSNLSKTFHLDISKEGLENEFDRNYERVRAEAERTNGADEELAGYYRQVEAACEGAGGVTGVSDGRERRVTGEKSEDERVYPEISGKDTQAENGKTEAILRESRNARRNAEVERRNSADDSRTVRNAETQSVFTAEQRRFEKQKRIDEQERARVARRRNKRRSGPEL